MSLLEDTEKKAEALSESLEALNNFENEIEVVDYEKTTSDECKSENTNKGLGLPAIMETKRGFYIDGTNIPFVVQDSVSVKYVGTTPLVTLTIAAKSFSFGEDKQPYQFNEH